MAAFNNIMSTFQKIKTVNSLTLRANYVADESKRTVITDMINKLSERAGDTNDAQWLKLEDEIGRMIIT